MSRINIGNNAFILPEPQSIVGTHYEGRANFMALAWLTRVNYQPCLFAVTVNKNHATGLGIVESGEFSINIPHEGMHKETDLMGLLSGKRVDKSQFFDLHYGELKKAPLIKDCPIAMECKLVKTVELDTNMIFIGELVGTWTEDKYMTDGYIDIEKVKPMTLSMPDNHYWGLGRKIGKAWHDGKELKDQLKK
ncbi:flavin reductase family protein [Maridesulfovibrio sp.]|uniref:flavin reductase family protein n=1 Tax=Maridesulfovibrio sp. TaxID=2795000 RepID=UPI003BAD3C2D